MQVSLYERDFTLTTSTLLDGFPMEVTKLGTYANLPPGTPYRLDVVPFRNGFINNDAVSDHIETACACQLTDFTEDNSIDRSGKPVDVKATQSRGRMFLSWVDLSLCEEVCVSLIVSFLTQFQAFAFTRVTDSGAVGFTDVRRCLALTVAKICSGILLCFFRCLPS